MIQTIIFLFYFIINCVAWQYGHNLSAINENFPSSTFANISTVLVFIGHARSGSTVVGSILDAHPNIIISNEVDLLSNLEVWQRQFLQCRSNCVEHARKLLFELYSIMLDNSVQYGKSRVHTGFNYSIPGQGEWRNFKVIGDKKAGKTAHMLAYMFNKTITDFKFLESMGGVSVKFVHVVRNPFDIIATMLRRQMFDGAAYFEHRHDMLTPDVETLQKTTRRVFQLERSIAQLKNTKLFDIIELHHVDLLAHTERELQRVCTWLGDITYDKQWALNSKQILHERPSRSRDFLVWPQSIVDSIIKQSQQDTSFSRYTNDLPSTNKK